MENWVYADCISAGFFNGGNGGGSGYGGGGSGGGSGGIGLTVVVILGESPHLIDDKLRWKI